MELVVRPAKQLSPSLEFHRKVVAGNRETRCNPFEKLMEENRLIKLIENVDLLAGGVGVREPRRYD